VAFDGERRLLVLAQNRIAVSMRLVPREEIVHEFGEERPLGLSLQRGTPYAVLQDVVLSPFGAPCTPPPWGTLMAVDLDTGEKRWEIPFGTVRRFLPIPLPIPIGMPHMGGPIATASGLVFIGAAMDDYLRAYDIETGEELWRHSLPAGGQATPMTYRLGAEGRQFVVIAAGGHGMLGTRKGDYLLAFALPR
jgi:quinoprotein glucose dehydrogenase